MNISHNGVSRRSLFGAVAASILAPFLPLRELTTKSWLGSVSRLKPYKAMRGFVPGVTPDLLSVGPRFYAVEGKGGSLYTDLPAPEFEMGPLEVYENIDELYLGDSVSRAAAHCVELTHEEPVEFLYGMSRELSDPTYSMVVSTSDITT